MSSKPLPKVTPRKPPPTLGGARASSKDSLISSHQPPTPSTAASPSRSPHPRTTNDSSTYSTSSGGAFAFSSPLLASSAPFEQENDDHPSKPPSVPVKPYPPRLTLQPRGPSAVNNGGLGEGSHPLSPFTLSFEAADIAVSPPSSAASSANRTKSNSIKKQKNLLAPSSSPPADFTLSDPQFFPRKYRQTQKAGSSSRPDSYLSTYTASSARAAVVHTASRQTLQKVSAKIRGKPLKTGSISQIEEDTRGKDGSLWQDREIEQEEEEEDDEAGENDSICEVPSGSDYDPDEPSTSLAQQMDFSSTNRQSLANGSSTQLGPSSKRNGQTANSSSAGGQSIPYSSRASSSSFQAQLSPTNSASFNLKPSTSGRSIEQRAAEGGEPSSTSKSAMLKGKSGTTLPKNRVSGSSKANSILSIRRPSESQRVSSQSVARTRSFTVKRSLSTSTSIFSLEDVVRQEDFAPGQWAELSEPAASRTVRRSSNRSDIANDDDEEEEEEEDVNLSKLAAFSFPHVVSPTTALPHSARLDVTDTSLSPSEQSGNASRKLKWKEAIALAQQKEREAAAGHSQNGLRLATGSSLTGAATGQNGLKDGNQDRRVSNVSVASMGRNGASMIPQSLSLNQLLGNFQSSATSATSVALSKNSLLSDLLSSQASAEVSANFSTSSLFASVEEFESAKKELARLQNRLIDKNNKLRTMKRLRGARGKLVRAATSDRGSGAMSTSGSQESNLAPSVRSRSNTLTVPGPPGVSPTTQVGGLFPLIPPAPRFSHSHNLSHSSNASASTSYTASQPWSLSALGTSNEALDAATAQVDHIMEEIVSLQERTAELKSRIREHIAIVLVRRCEDLENSLKQRGVVYVREHFVDEEDDQGVGEDVQNRDISGNESQQGHSLTQPIKTTAKLPTSLTFIDPDELANLRSEAEELASVKDKEAQSTQELTDLRTQIDILKVDHQDKCERNEIELKKTRQELANVQDSASMIADKLRQSNLQHERLVAEHESLQSQHDNLHAQHQDLASRHRDLTSSQNKTASESEARSASMEAQGAEQQQRELEMVSRHKAVIEELQRSLQQHRDEAEVAKEELLSLKSKAAVSQSELANALAKITLLETTAGEQKASAAGYQQELQMQLDRALSRSSALERQVTDLQSTVTSSNALQSTLQGQIVLLQSQVASHLATSASQKDEVRSAIAQHDALELAVTAERRIMAERDALFHAFEARLEKAEEILREQDKRCAALLGKAEGREELDDFLAKIKGVGAKKQDKTAGQDIDALLQSLGDHVEDLADELARRGRGMSSVLYDEDHHDGQQSSGKGGPRDDERAMAVIAELEEHLGDAQQEVDQLREKLQMTQAQLDEVRTSASDTEASDVYRARISELESRVIQLQNEVERGRREAAHGRRPKSPGDSIEDDQGSLVKVAGSDHEGEPSKGRHKDMGHRSSALPETIRDLVGALQDLLPSNLDANLAACEDLKALQIALEAVPPTSRSSTSTAKPAILGRGSSNNSPSPVAKAVRPGFGAAKGGSVKDLVRSFSSGDPAETTTASFSPTKKPITVMQASAAEETSINTLIDRARLTLLAARGATQKALSNEVTREELQRQLKEALEQNEEHRRRIEDLESRSQDLRAQEEMVTVSGPSQDVTLSYDTPSSYQSPLVPIPQRSLLSGAGLEPIQSRSVDSMHDPFLISGFTPPAALSAPSTVSRRGDAGGAGGGTMGKSRLKPLNSAAFLGNVGYDTGRGGGLGVASLPGSNSASPSRAYKQLPVAPLDIPGGASPTVPSFGLGHPSSASSDITMRRSVSAHHPSVSSKTLDFKSSTSGNANSGGGGGGSGSSSSLVPQRSITLGLSTSQLVSRIRTLESEISHHVHSHSTSKKRSADQVLVLEKTLQVKEEEVRQLREEVLRVREEEGLQKARLLEELNNLQEEIAIKSIGGGIASSHSAGAGAGANASGSGNGGNGGGNGNGGGTTTTFLQTPSSTTTTSTFAQSVRAASPFSGWKSSNGASSTSPPP